MLSKELKIVGCDTDSIMFCKPDQTPFSDEEQVELIKSINSIFPEKIKWEHDGIFTNVVYVKAKNYVLKTPDGKVKTKGSALKATGKEVALKEFIKRIIDCLLNDTQDAIVPIYHEYVKEIVNLKDITRWSSKKTITEKVLAAERTTEQKVSDAIEDSEYTIGDKIYCYFANDESIKLQEHWTNDHHVDKLLEKLYKTSLTFSTVVDKILFVNYKLKRNKKPLEELLK